MPIAIKPKKQNRRQYMDGSFRPWKKSAAFAVNPRGILTHRVKHVDTIMKSWLIGCEKSGIIREAMRRIGIDAWSCDTEPARDGSPNHIQDDIRNVVNLRGGNRWNGLILHPECTYLSSSGQHWNGRQLGREEKTQQAIDFFMWCVRAIQWIGKGRIENPVGIMSTRYRKPDQIIQPFEYGDDASKQTCLWNYGLPLLVGTKYIFPRWVCVSCKSIHRLAVHHKMKQNCSCGGKMLPRWANQTNSGQNKLGPSDDRKEKRSNTYPGIAEAIANAT